jgi:hypothetical protein
VLASLPLVLPFSSPSIAETAEQSSRKKIRLPPEDIDKLQREYDATQLHQERGGEEKKARGATVLAWLFQKEIHAVEVDDTVTVIQCIHP